jgi:TonB-linked SusC/RagA family outer membrane protein
MSKVPPGRGLLPNALRRVRAAGIGLLLAAGLSETTSAQAPRITISGTVTTSDGVPLSGVAVSTVGASARAATASNGRYTITNVPADATLRFSLIGWKAVTQPVAGRSQIDVRLEHVATSLSEVVVTGYGEQRRQDITGAVASVDTTALHREIGASVLQRLDAIAPGVSVAASGSPGSRSTVRIRGISSFQNNDPLYVVDGTPVQDSYVNWLNPEDVTSVQVLKDASAASIYGSRASNGVILIETTRRNVNSAPRSTLTLRTGMSSPVRGYDDFLLTDALSYYQVVQQSYVNAGQTPPVNVFGSATSPVVPAYTWPNNCGPAGKAGVCTNVDVNSYAYPGNLIMPGSAGTNWWKAVFHSAPLTEANLSVAGGSPENTYNVSFNYYDQNGTARYNDYRRGTVRANTEFRRSRLTFGENLAVGLDRSYGGVGDDNYGEGNILGKNILMQPVVPIYDVAGNFASGKATSLGNNTNPLKVAYEGRNNISQNNRVFGNTFVSYRPMEPLNLMSRFGFSVGNQQYNQYNPITPENSEPTTNNSIYQFTTNFTDWTWSNTAQYTKSLGQSIFDFLLGQETNGGTNRYAECREANLLNTSTDSRYCSATLGDIPTALSTGGKYGLLSFFGRLNYTFADRYVATATVRRDGSSRLGEQWGTFPAFGLAWHATNESWFPRGGLLSDLNIRYGWGVTGNQSIPAGRIVSQFGGSTGETFYDINGTKTSIIAGYRQTSIGNPNLKWEENRSQNLGADVALFQNNLNVVIDVYRRTTNNLLFNPALPATAGVASPPIVNIGSMRNNGFDFSIGHTASWWNLTLNGSHYTNKILTIADDQTSFAGPVSIRFGNPIINQVGSPISSFYGYIADGYFSDATDVASHATQDGAAPGRIKFRDLNGDGKINASDRTIIGSPHPKFSAGLDLGARWRSFDFSSTVFGTFGNKIFDAQKQFYVFRNFDTNVVSDLLENSWTPTNQDAKYPRLDVSDSYSYAMSSYYVEDGSYVRMRNLQIGYRIPDGLPVVRALSGTRVYLQAENLFTITKYDGLDPALPVQRLDTNINAAAGDIRDQFRGVDQGVYPSSRIFSIGLTTSF